MEYYVTHGQDTSANGLPKTAASAAWRGTGLQQIVSVGSLEMKFAQDMMPFQEAKQRLRIAKKMSGEATASGIGEAAKQSCQVRAKASAGQSQAVQGAKPMASGQYCLPRGLRILREANRSQRGQARRRSLTHRALGSREEVHRPSASYRFETSRGSAREVMAGDNNI
jgi:hypothetical protein